MSLDTQPIYLAGGVLAVTVIVSCWKLYQAKREGRKEAEQMRRSAEGVR